jgi:uncharacterized protein (DUF342 family)
MIKIVLIKMFGIIVLLGAAWGSAFGQIDQQCPHINLITRGNHPMRDSNAVRDQLVNLCIKGLKKDFEEMVARTEEISKLSDELKEAYELNNRLSKKDMEKVEKVRILVKKVKKDLKASDDDDEDDQKPKSVLAAINSLQEQAGNLLTAVKNSTRHSISLATVKTTNAVYRLVKFLRIRK